MSEHADKLAEALEEIKHRVTCGPLSREGYINVIELVSKTATEALAAYRAERVR